MIDIRNNLLPIAVGLKLVLEISPKVSVELFLRDEFEKVRVESHLSFEREYTVCGQSNDRCNTLSRVTGSRNGEMPL